MFTLCDVQIWTFPAAPSTERVPSVAERVAYLRYSINLQLFNWRVPALIEKQLRVHQTRPHYVWLCKLSLTNLILCPLFLSWSLATKYSKVRQKSQGLHI